MINHQFPAVQEGCRARAQAREHALVKADARANKRTSHNHSEIKMN